MVGKMISLLAAPSSRLIGMLKNAEDRNGSTFLEAYRNAEDRNGWEDDIIAGSTFLEA